jgi:hypothetical protein
VPNCSVGLTLRQATLIAGFGYLLDPVSYAQLTLYPKLVIPGHIEQTANLDFIFVTFFGELIFMLWLLIMGWRIKEPA